VLVIALLASLTYAIIEGPSRGWLSGEILGLFAVSAASAIGLVSHERRRAEPLLEVHFFRSAPFSGASVIAVCAFAALAGFLFLNTLYLQETRHLSPLHAGLYMLPPAAMSVIFGPLSGWIVGRRGTRPPLIVAGVAMTASGLLLTQLTAGTSFAYLVFSYVVFGMPPEQAGVAAAVASTSRQVGATLGVAIVGAVAAPSVAAAIGGNFAQASHAGWWIIAGLGAMVLLLGLLTTTSRAKATADRYGDPLALER
jgi:predicted MFS family arabinose efflux permease